MKEKILVGLIIIILIIVPKNIVAQNGFDPVDNTGKTSAVVIDTINIINDVCEMNIGDEIGVFDDDICVGKGVFDGDFPIYFSAVLEYITPNGDTLQGATEGDPMIFKVFFENTQEIVEATPEYESGGIFGDILTIVNVLKIKKSDNSDINIMNQAPKEVILYQNYPNPFNPITNIAYQVGTYEKVIITIYDNRGRYIFTLVDKKQKPGFYTVRWDGCNVYGNEVCSGIYFINIKTKNYVTSKKILKIK